MGLVLPSARPGVGAATSHLRTEALRDPRPRGPPRGGSPPAPRQLPLGGWTARTVGAGHISTRRKPRPGDPAVPSRLVSPDISLSHSSGQLRSSSRRPDVCNRSPTWPGSTGSAASGPSQRLRAEGQGGSYLRPLPNPDTLGWASGLPAAPRSLQEAEAWVPGPGCPDGGPSRTRRAACPPALCPHPQPHRTGSWAPVSHPMEFHRTSSRVGPLGPAALVRSRRNGPIEVPAACQLDSRVFSRQIRK